MLASGTASPVGWEVDKIPSLFREPLINRSRTCSL
uniref:Uncharacterized protein n=1 Tax=Rhizophora mucronata TaxID=61149 RepID=A0A2P2QQH3_RHIMU